MEDPRNIDFAINNARKILSNCEEKFIQKKFVDFSVYI